MTKKAFYIPCAASVFIFAVGAVVTTLRATVLANCLEPVTPTPVTNTTTAAAEMNKAFCHFMSQLGLSAAASSNAAPFVFGVALMAAGILLFVASSLPGGKVEPSVGHSSKQRVCCSV